MNTKNHPLMSQLSIISKISQTQIEKLILEVMNITDEQTQQYKDYQNGGWDTLTLMGATKDPYDTSIRDCTPVATSLLSKMHFTKTFLESLNLDYMWVRVAKLNSKAFLWEHVDYTELNKEKHIRLHVPLFTNINARIVLPNNDVFMSKGYIWKLIPTERHAVYNNGNTSRIHLIIDCYDSPEIRKLIKSEELPFNVVNKLPLIDKKEINNKIERAKEIYELGYKTAAENSLLKIFHFFSTYKGQSYDAVIHMYDKLKEKEESKRWKEKKKMILGLD